MGSVNHSLTVNIVEIFRIQSVKHWFEYILSSDKSNEDFKY